MGEEAAPQKGDLGQAGNCDIGKSVFDIGIICHNRPAPSLQAVSDKEINAQSEGCQGKAGNILICLQRYGKCGKQQTAQGTCQKSHGNTHPKTVGIAAEDVPKYCAHSHDTFHTKVQASGLFYNNLTHSTIEKGNVENDNIMDKGC